MEKEHIDNIKIEGYIKNCEKEGHVQQVVFSTYHHALTQICFSCGMVRTSMSKGDI